MPLRTVNRLTWQTFLRSRSISLIAVLSTILTLIVLTYRAPVDAEWLIRYYGIDAITLQQFYAGLIAVLLLVVVLEPAVRRELSDGKGTALLIAAAGLIAVLLVRLNFPDQTTRLRVYPFSLWLVIVHLMGLCALLVLLVTEQPLDSPTRRVRFYAGLVAAVFGVGLVGLHILSVGRFVQIDLPDEPWFASAATHFVETGRLSPTFLASAYGDPDPVMPGYYALIGFWLRAAGDSLLNLRLIPLALGLASAVIVTAALHRETPLSTAQKIIGVVTMLGLSAFVRASHNLRPDIQLAVYTALVLFGLLAFLRQKSRWSALLMGAALYVGLEAVPTAALGFGAILGAALMSQCLRRRDWQYVLIYGAGCSAAGALYAAGHFLPNVQANLDQYRAFTLSYQQSNALGFANPFAWLGGYITRFSLILSPVEIVVLGGAFALLIWRGSRQDRLIGLMVGAAFVLLPTFIRTSFGYMAMFAPFAAYAAARACRWQLVMVIGAFVLLPSLSAAPLQDMALDTSLNLNERLLAEVDLLTWRIPAGMTVVGDDVFWFTLHQNRRFIGWEGVWRYASIHQITPDEAVRELNVDVLICFAEEPDRCALASPEMYEPPIDFVITRGRYLIFVRRPSTPFLDDRLSPVDGEAPAAEAAVAD
jgi:hypothetical protein